MWAAANGSVAMTALLLDHGADIAQAKTDKGHTALIIAAQENKAAVVQLLLDRGADPVFLAWA